MTPSLDAPSTPTAEPLMDSPRETLPVDLMAMAGPLYTQALWLKLMPATGAPELLFFTFRYAREGFLVDLAPHVEPLLARRVSQVLGETIEMTQALPPREVVWLGAQLQGVSREKFEADYERTRKLFVETPVNGWDVVRFLALGGGLVASYRNEGLLTLQVSREGLSFGMAALPGKVLANDMRIAPPAAAGNRPGAQSTSGIGGDLQISGTSEAADDLDGQPPDPPTFH